MRAQYRIDHWTADDGLPQNSVYEIVQTRDGYLWLATLDGLARFDGVRFEIFNKGNSAGIVNNRFVSLFEAANGDLWAGTEMSGAGRFHVGRFEHFAAETGVPRIVYGIAADADNADGAILLNENAQAFRFSDGKFAPFAGRSNAAPPAQIVRSASLKIACRADSKNQFSECLIGGQWIDFSIGDNPPPMSFVRAAQETANGTVWLITVDGRLARAENGKITGIFDERDNLPKYPLYFITGARLSFVAKDAGGALWMIDLPSMRKELLFKKTAALDRTEILSTYQDGEGNLWFGSRRDGLFRARKQVVTAYSEADGILDKNVYPIYEDRAGIVWIGTTTGLFKYETGTFTLIESTKNKFIDAIGEDVSGRVLVSSFGVLSVLENNQFVPFEPEKILTQGAIFAIHADREKTLWIGGEKGLRRFKDGVVTSWTIADGLAGDDVKTIIEARSGGLWIGTYDGLTRLENGRLTNWRETDGLPSRTIRALYEDADGTLWIGSYDGGLARFKNGKFTRYDSKTGLPNDGAFQILEDENRNFWISSNRGIYRVNKDELNDYADGKISRVNSIAYGKSDGMLNAEANGGRSPGGVKTRDGHLWFPTQDGAAVIDPETVKANPKAPPVVIETVKIDNILSEPPAVAGGQNATGSNINENLSATADGSDIIIAPDQQSFEISYTALSFINSENLRFKYKLEGLDSDWVDAGMRRTAYFSHVPPGEYTFHVIAANSDNVWNEQGAAIEIIVRPAFYQTWWFWVLCVAAIGLIVLIINRRRLNESRRRQFAQEDFSRRLINAHETERRRVAAELHDSIGQSLAMIKNSAVFGANTASDLSEAKEQLQEISGASAQAISEVREIAYNLRPYLVDRLGLTKAIIELLEKIEDNSALEIDEELEDIDDLFEKEAEISIYRIVQESLNNILKHSDATKARVSMIETTRSVKIEIADNGKGFDVHSASETDKRGGFGLLGMSERVRMLGGTLAIESAANKGAKIEIELWKRKLKS